MSSRPATAEAAYQKAAGIPEIRGAPEGVPIHQSTAFTCSYCGVNSQHRWGVVTNPTVYTGYDGQTNRSYVGPALVAAYCETCRMETLFLEGSVVAPLYSPAPLPAGDMPTEVVADYEEARVIVSASPRGAAALLRLVIQKLCLILGSSKSDINSAIGELVEKGDISPRIQQALDTVRVIGNESVHPGIIDMRDDAATAISMFGLINFIVEKAISEPKQIDGLYQALPPGKLAGIAQRDAGKN